MMNRKAIAGMLVMAIALAGVAIAVSAEGEGGVGPMGILPGAISWNHLSNIVQTEIKTVENSEITSNAVNSSQIINGTIVDQDLGANAIPSVTDERDVHTDGGVVWTNITMPDNNGTVKYLITYSASVRPDNLTSPENVNVTIYMANSTNVSYHTLYEITPASAQTLVDGYAGTNITHTVQFFNASVAPASEVCGGYTAGEKHYQVCAKVAT